MAQSNCSGWLLARTSMNLDAETEQFINQSISQSIINKVWCRRLLVALLSGAIQESVEGGSEVFADLLLQTHTEACCPASDTQTSTVVHRQVGGPATHSGSLAEEGVGLVHEEQQPGTE